MIRRSRAWLPAAVAAVLAFAPTSAWAAGTNMPWEGPLDRVVTSLTGPVAKGLGVLAIVGLGFAFAFSEGGSTLRRRPGRRRSDYLPWAALVSPDVVPDKDGSFLAVLRYRGPDLESCGGHDLVSARARLNNALRRLGSGWCPHAEARRRPSQHYPRVRVPVMS